MNHIVNRESVGMRQFSAESSIIAYELEDICSHLRQLLYDANSYMQDNSGIEAIQIVTELVADTLVSLSHIRNLSDHISNSAILLEESNTLL